MSKCCPESILGRVMGPEATLRGVEMRKWEYFTRLPPGMGVGLGSPPVGGGTGNQIRGDKTQELGASL